MKIYTHIISLLLAGTMTLSPAAYCQDAGSQMVESVKIETISECPVMEVSFNLPVFYIQHEPLSEGDSLLIRLKVIPTDDDQDSMILERSAISLPKQTLIPITQMIYDGDYDDAPYLIINFSRQIKFTVDQGKDFRSLVIFTSHDLHDEECPPKLTIPELVGQLELL